eukprot:287111-Chlamydomonas_euryale.AAC.1
MQGSSASPEPQPQLNTSRSYTCLTHASKVAHELPAAGTACSGAQSWYSPGPEPGSSSAFAMKSTSSSWEMLRWRSAYAILASSSCCSRSASSAFEPAPPSLAACCCRASYAVSRCARAIARARSAWRALASSSSSVVSPTNSCSRTYSTDSSCAASGPASASAAAAAKMSTPASTPPEKALRMQAVAARRRE